MIGNVIAPRKEIMNIMPIDNPTRATAEACVLNANSTSMIEPVNPAVMAQIANERTAKVIGLFMVLSHS